MFINKHCKFDNVELKEAAYDGDIRVIISSSAKVGALGVIKHIRLIQGWSFRQWNLSREKNKHRKHTQSYAFASLAHTSGQLMGATWKGV
jgi:hypothetical protein